jgi:hypothetical protein
MKRVSVEILIEPSHERVEDYYELNKKDFGLNKAGDKT